MPLDNPAPSRLEQRLRRETRGEVLFDRFSRGRYSTDASVYQIEPLGVVVPKAREDVAAALQIARDEGVPVLPRGGGTSQCGQTVARALVIDCSKYMHKVVSLDLENRRVRVEPGVVMERLNQSLRRHKLWFPVDVSTGDRATIGGMTANNSCGSRSIRYGNMVHNVRAIDALLADGTAARFAEVPGNFDESVAPERYRDLVREMRDLHRREADEIKARFPKLLRRVGGYNIDMIGPDNSTGGHNMPICWSALKAPSPSSTRSSSTSSRSPRTGSSASAISPASTRRWRRRSTSSSWARARSSWSIGR